MTQESGAEHLLVVRRDVPDRFLVVDEATPFERGAGERDANDFPKRSEYEIDKQTGATSEGVETALRIVADPEDAVDTENADTRRKHGVSVGQYDSPRETS